MTFGPPGSSLGHIDRFKDAPGVLWRRPGDAPGAPQDVPGSFSGPFWEAQGVPRRPFWSCFDTTVLWMAGCAQRDMGDVEGDMAVPGRSGLQMSALDPSTTRPSRGPGEG